MASSGQRLRSYIEARWLEMGNRRHGMVTALAAESGVLRNTITGWFTKSRVPRLDALGAVAEVLGRPRAELVAAFDGQELITYDRARLIVREELAAAQDATAAASTPGPSSEPTGGTVHRQSAA